MNDIFYRKSEKLELFLINKINDLKNIHNQLRTKFYLNIRYLIVSYNDNFLTIKNKKI